MSDLIYNVSNNNLEKSDQQRHQELCDNFEMVKLQQKKYLQKKFILSAVSKCINEDIDLHDELKDKVRSILLCKEVIPCMSLNTKYSEEKLFGLDDLHDTELSFNEQETLRQSVSSSLKLLQEHCISLYNEQEQIFEDNSNLFNLCLQDKVLLESINKVNILQDSNMRNLKHLYDSLQELLQLRFKDVEDIVAKKIDEYSIKSNMYSLRSEMISGKTRIDVFNENPISCMAYREMLKDISEQQKECEKQIDELNLLKEKYKFISCKEYDEILKSYMQYKNLIEKRKLIYKQLKEK